MSRWLVDELILALHSDSLRVLRVGHYCTHQS